MPTLSTQFEHELKKRIEQRQLEIAEILCTGTAIKDFSDYLRYIGEFRGLKNVSDMYCDEVNTTINQR